MSILQLDFETHSECPINQEGAYKYAMHPSTGIYCLGWAFDDEPVEVWLPGEPFPARIYRHIKMGGVITAWNATFERLIMWYVLCPDYDLPEPALAQFRCTAAKARASAMPSALADAARCLDLPIQKMPEGKRLIKEYCAQNVPWSDIPEADQTLMIEYCRVDVETERAVGECVRELTDSEWEEYHINETINDRGIPVDVEMAHHALCYAEEVREEVDQKIATLTEYAVSTSRQRKTRDEWIFPQLDETARTAITKKPAHVDEETGETVAATYSFDQDHRDALRVVPGLPEPVLEYLDLLDEAGGATIAKYAAMTNMEIDARVNGTIMFNGAGQTGRFCIAEDSQIVVMDKAGLVYAKPIQNLQLDEFVWDGEDFVHHDGVVFTGEKEVIQYDGVTATPDHKIFTQQGDKIPISEAAARGDRIRVSQRPDPKRILAS